MPDDDTTPQDDTTPTPEPTPAPVDATVDEPADEPTEPTAVAETPPPAGKPAKSDRPGVFVPRWLLILLGLVIVILLAAGGGFWAGRETADDDNGDDQQSSQSVPGNGTPDAPDGPFPLPELPDQPDEDAAFLGVGVSDSDDPAGALVDDVAPGSPAEDAGLEEGDVIVAVDGDEVDGVESLGEALAARDPGDVVTLTVDRDGTETTLQPTLSTPDAQSA